MEDRLFAELQNELISKLSFGPKDEVNRFQHNSVSNPLTWPRNWNRSFHDLKPKAPMLPSYCYTACRIPPTACEK
jgi:hypothetical protein